jgi:hypothetical protein
VPIVCGHDGEEHLETEALGWTASDVYVARAAAPRGCLVRVYMAGADPGVWHYDRLAVGTYMIRLMGAVDHSSRRPLAPGSGPRVQKVPHA